MKALFPIVLILFYLAAGCASLGLQPNSNQDEKEIDPVAAMAEQYRRSNPDSEENRIEREAQALKIEVARYNGELALGMSSQDVLEILGQPRDVETAGIPGTGFERWVYFDGLSTSWSMSTAHVVTFERGTVVGWRKYRR
jgi:hypothetical protein